MSIFRFDETLRPLLAPGHRASEIEHALASHETLKHAIEALGVPHTEIGRVTCNGLPVSLERHGGGATDVIEVHAVPPSPPWPHGEPPRFIADVHLVRLARYLRFAGYDTLHRDAWPDAALAATAAQEQRIVLSRDKALLMHRTVERGCHVRSGDPLRQLAVVASRYGLHRHTGTAPRCLLCNTPLLPVHKNRVAARLPPAVQAAFDRFWQCPSCERVYWRGSHWRRMRQALSDAGFPAPA